MAKNHEIEMSQFITCMHDPQALLAKALEERNLYEFKMALEMDADPTKMDETTNISVFEKALQNYECVEFVAECIRRGCRYDYINRRLNKRPINFAADSRNPQILSYLLKSRDILIDSKYASLTPLNSLAKNLTSENVDDVFQCIKQLVEYGANPNIADQKEMTPILYIINNRKLDNDKKKDIINYMIEYSEVDLDTFRDGEAREKLKSQFPNIKLPQQKTHGLSFETLLTLLKNGDEEKFIRVFNDYQANLSNEENQQSITQEQSISLLIEAIKKGLNEALNILIKTGININIVEKGNTSIEIACIHGNCKALQMLLEQDELQLRKYENLLITVIKKLDESTYNSFSDYYACFYTLLDSSKIDINEVDPSGSSALHYAVKYKNEKAVIELLKRGAYIGTRSRFNDIPISGINPEVLEEFFDSCITTNGLKPGDDNFEIIIKYANLIPTQRARTKSDMCAINEEMLPIEHIADSKDLRHLLKHPLITSFLFLKWHRLSVIFYINFLLYSLFCVSLVTYIILHFNNETDGAIVGTFKTFSFLGLVYMIFREAIQFIISPQMFIRSTVNFLEIALILLTIVTLCDPNYEKETQRVLAVFTILLASVELCLLVGSLPVLSISTHMLMLRAVSSTFIKSFTLYSIFVITFSICFYILFGKVENPNENTGEDSENGEFNNFVNPFTAIIKTIVMMTGEFDAGDINFNSFISYLVFLIFVVFMSIVLFNLLNGLAVSDTQVIKAQAELNGCICRTYLLANYEKSLIGRNGQRASFINYQPFKSICKRLTNLFPNYINGLHIAILPNDNNKILVPVSPIRKIDSTPLKRNGSAFLYRNGDETDREKKILGAPLRVLPCCCVCFKGKCSEMDVRTVKTAMAVIEKKQLLHKHKQKIYEMENRLKKIDDKVDKVLLLLQEINAR